MGENKDVLFGYPCRRHSCSVVNIPTPCVNKMISHIQDVESKIQEYLKQFETAYGEWSAASSTKGVTEDWSTSIAASEEKVKTEVEDEKCPEIKQEMGTLLSEAIHLIKSLETDRAEAEEALRQQKLRKQKINMKIDSWSIWRLQELPSAVQKEHETYLRDIIELRWHLGDKAHQLENLKEEKTKLEEANAKIQADIDYINEHAPLLDSKQKQELEALRECYLKKFEVMEKYKNVHEELEEATENCQNTKLNAEQIKAEMDRDIQQNETDMDNYKKQIDKLCDLCTYYSSSIEDVNIDIEEKEQAATEALKETTSSTNELAALSKKLEEVRQCQPLDLFALQYGLQLNINKTKILTTEQIRKKAEYEFEVQSLLKLKANNNEFLKELYKEAYNIGAIFHITKFKTDELEGKIAEVRRKFKGREDNLKKLIRNEVSTTLLIQKNLCCVQDAQGKERQDLTDKKTLYALTLTQLEEPLVELEEEAIRIRSLHEEHSDKLNEIMEKKKHIKRNVERTRKKLRLQEKKTREALTQTEEKRSTIFKEISETKSKTSIFQSKINKLNEEFLLKDQEKKNYDKILDILNEKFLSIRYKKEHAEIVFDHLKNERKSCQERRYEEEERFKGLICMRQKTLRDIKETQLNSLQENLFLAQEYQKAQDLFLREKEKYFNMYVRQLSLDASIRDTIQLCQLQRRIHKVWETHFKLVALCSRMRLAKFQTDSQESIQKILAVQEESSNLMQHIFAFFQSLTDGQCENDG
ncbi:coiled-coil domain-containing protein 178 [Orycteropus afer afer]|uniref:Coiled-coil domain-containing protein 178 n=1 Tax=Orycteropus afer afer TaxID=1230840 RepID=A0A8B7A7D0_ORYAF|nr:coiled-coil domain-containing protein 178 [Orycteropus afer afer]